MKKKKIILSYDYELFFGDRSGTVQKSIIEPTNKLMDVMEQNGFRGNFFVDYLMFRELEKLSDERAVADLKMLKEQIKDMVKRGHRIELHLHPHWVDAKYNGDGTWNFADFTHYSLSSLGEESIVEMFKEGTNYLNRLAGEAEPGYKIVAFRAGGWAVQPFDKLKKGFEVSGIKIDSSASFGAYSEKENQGYDFRGMPDKVCYRFSNDVCKEDAEGDYLEVPITSFHIASWLYLREMYLRKFTSYFHHFADGTHERKKRPQKTHKPLIKKVVDKFDNSNKVLINFSFISLSPIEHFLKSNNCCLVCFIDHPKDVSPSTLDGIRGIGKWCESINYLNIVNNYESILF